MLMAVSRFLRTDSIPVLEPGISLGSAIRRPWPVTVSTGSATINEILTATFLCSPFVHGRVRHRPDIPCWVADSPDARWRTLAANTESGRTRSHGRAPPDLGKRVEPL